MSCRDPALILKFMELCSLQISTGLHFDQSQHRLLIVPASIPVFFAVWSYRDMGKLLVIKLGP